MKRLIIVVLVGVIVATGIFALMHISSAPTTLPISSSNSTTNSPASNSSDTQNSSKVITYNGTSFSPAEITVLSGSIVTVKNVSSKTIQFDSDPHPIHTDDADLNAGTIAAGQSKSFTVTQKGTFGYHNHLDSSQTGSIIIN